MSVGVSACVLELPAQEFAQLQSMAAQGSGQVLLRLASECQESDVVLFNVTVFTTQANLRLPCCYISMYYIGSATQN